MEATEATSMKCTSTHWIVLCVVLSRYSDDFEETEEVADADLAGEGAAAEGEVHFFCRFVQRFSERCRNEKRAMGTRTR